MWRYLALLTFASLHFLPGDDAALAERKKARQADEKRERATATLSLDKGWKKVDLPPFILVTEGKDSFAREIGSDTALLWKYLDAQFPMVGPGEYVRSPVVRVYAESEKAERALAKGRWVMVDKYPPPILVAASTWGGPAAMRRMGEVWFQEHDQDLWFALPGWLRAGLSEMFLVGRSKGGAMCFDPTGETAMKFATFCQEGRFVPTRKFLQTRLPREVIADDEMERDFHPSLQAGQFVRHVLHGKASTNVRYRSVIQDCVATTQTLLPELRKKVDEILLKDKIPPAAATATQRALAYERIERKVIDAVFDKVFSKWTDKDWEYFDDIFNYER